MLHGPPPEELMAEPEPQQLPPHNIEAEEEVLGSLLIDAEGCAGKIAFLDQGDFFREKNATVYEALLALLRRGDAVDQLTVGEQLKTTGEFEQVGGHAFLSHLVSIIPTSVHAPYYARIVHRTAALRRAIRSSHELVGKAHENPADSRPLAHDYIKIGLGLLDLDTDEARDLKPVRDVLDTHFNERRNDACLSALTGQRSPGREHLPMYIEWRLVRRTCNPIACVIFGGHACGPQTRSLTGRKEALLDFGRWR